MPKAKVSVATPVVISFVAGIVSAPYFKPLARRLVRASVGVALQMKRVAAGAAEEFQDIMAEANAASNAAPDS